MATELTKREQFIVQATKLQFYKKLRKKTEAMLNAELEIDDYDTEVFHKILELEDIVDEMEFQLECEGIDLPKLD